jgi:cell division protein FtsB
MPVGPRPPSRPGAGPGRGRPRGRTAPHRPPVGRPTAQEAARHAEQSAEEAAQTEAAVRRRSSVTTRAIALAVVFLILTISYASSLRIYFAQSAQIATTKQQIALSQQRITDLQTDLSRWNDPEYVKTQARARLGWVVPGETGFTVVGEDGQPLGGGAQISSAKPPAVAQTAWWDKMWGSVEAADQPAPAPAPKPTTPPAITEKTKPQSSASPR